MKYLTIFGYDESKLIGIKVFNLIELWLTVLTICIKIANFDQIYSHSFCLLLSPIFSRSDLINLSSEQALLQLAAGYL